MSSMFWKKCIEIKYKMPSNLEDFFYTLKKNALSFGRKPSQAIKKCLHFYYQKIKYLHDLADVFYTQKVKCHKVFQDKILSSKS